MSFAVLIIVLFLIPLIGMILIPALPFSKRANVHMVFVLLTAVISSIPAVWALKGTALEVTMANTPVFGKLSLQIDSLSAWFILIINITCINGAFFGLGYMKQYIHQRTNITLHWVLFLLFQSSMIWVCMVQNGLMFLIVWELMSLFSFLLVLFDYKNNATLQAAIHYFVQMHIGVIFLTLAFIWVYTSEGSMEFNAISTFFSSHTNLWVFVLFFTGFGIKAGFVPLHSWLPQAHPAAPSHISGIMSGVMVKLGIYGIFRMVFLLKQDFIIIGSGIIIVALFTGLFGILNAAMHRDFKKMLAYCTIENIGIIGLGIGLGVIGMGNGNTMMMVLGFASALLHTLNHSLFKSLLFFSTGSVYLQTHTRDMEKLGGLIHHMPQTALLFLMGSLAIGGMPPFNGFISEFLLYSGILLGIKSLGIQYILLMVVSLAGLAIMGGVSMLTFTKSFGTIFLGHPRTGLQRVPQEVALTVRWPQYFILFLIGCIAIFSSHFVLLVNSIVYNTVETAATYKMQISPSLLNSLSSISLFSVLFIAIAALIYHIRKVVIHRRPFWVLPTWGCGYVSSTFKMQYTGKSFSKSLGKLLSFIILETKKYKEIPVNEVFPSGRSYSSHYIDFFVIKISDKMVNQLLHFMNYFQFIQNGKTQAYILYGVFFIVLVFFATIFKLL